MLLIIKKSCVKLTVYPPQMAPWFITTVFLSLLFSVLPFSIPEWCEKCLFICSIFYCNIMCLGAGVWLQESPVPRSFHPRGKRWAGLKFFHPLFWHTRVFFTAQMAIVFTKVLPLIMFKLKILTYSRISKSQLAISDRVSWKNEKEKLKIWSMLWKMREHVINCFRQTLPVAWRQCRVPRGGNGPGGCPSSHHPTASRDGDRQFGSYHARG